MNQYLIQVFCGLILALASPWVFAADQLPWKTYLFVVMAMALALASFMSFRNKKAETIMAKLLLTGLYFWVFTFAQLIILAFLYYINQSIGK